MSECKDCGRSDGKCDRDQQPFTEQDNPVSPNHYSYEGGVQVIDITRHMSFLDGNVVKYVTRAGRKGDRLTDLLKAKKYLDWAIEEEQK